MVAFGAFFAYQNAATDTRIKDLQGEATFNRNNIATLTAKFASHEERISKLNEDRQRIDAEILRLRPMIVSRDEHASADRERKTIIDGIAIRVDRFERDFGSVYSLKDALGDMNKRMDRIQAGKEIRP